MEIDEDMLSAINKAAKEMNIPVKVMMKIYEEQIYYLEFMMSQFSVYDKSSQMAIKIPYLCNFYVRVIKVYEKVQKHMRHPNFEKYKMNELKRIKKLFKTHPRHVKFIKGLRRHREAEWGFIADSVLQRALEQVQRKRERYRK